MYRDDANAGRCFVNQTPGYSVASACMMPEGHPRVKSVTARNPDSTGHLIGAAFAIGEGLGNEEAATVVCDAFGHLMGLDDSDNEDSCMFPASTPGEFRWYQSDDAEAVFALYAHDENAPATTTTTVAPTTTSSSTTTSSPTTTSSTTTTALICVDGTCLP